MVARTLVGHGIGAVPVLDAEGAAIGVISEADLLRAEEFRQLYYRDGYEPAGRSRHDRTPGYEARRKSEALTAGDVMTSPLVTVPPDTPAARAAREMDQEGVRRLLVADQGRVVGAVSRGDLLRVFVRDDADLVSEITEEVLGPAKWITMDRLTVTASDGVVTVSGRTPTRSEAELAVSMTRRVNGDDQRHPSRGPAALPAGPGPGSNGNEHSTPGGGAMSTLTRRDKGIIPEIFELLETPFLGTRPLRLEGVVHDGRYVLRAELPGVDPEDVEVTLTGDVLTIHAERHREDVEDVGAVHTEFRYGSLTRSVTLPKGAQEDNATAVYDKGILEITVKLSGAKETGTRIPVTIPQ